MHLVIWRLAESKRLVQKEIERKKCPSEVASCSAKRGCMISTSRFHYHLLKCVFFLGRSLWIIKLKWIDESVCVFHWTMSPTVTIPGRRWMTLVPAFLCHPRCYLTLWKPLCSFLFCSKWLHHSHLSIFHWNLSHQWIAEGFQVSLLKHCPKKQNVHHTNVFFKIKLRWSSLLGSCHLLMSRSACQMAPCPQTTEKNKMEGDLTMFSK